MELALQNAVTRFQELHPESRRLHELALESLPGGNTRTLLHTAPFPVFMRKGEGSQLWDRMGISTDFYTDVKNSDLIQFEDITT